MNLETIRWRNGYIELIDQLELPLRLVYVKCKDVESLHHAIKGLRVRGAPAIGIAAGLGVYLGIKDFKGSPAKFEKRLNKVIGYIGSSRPTAINLFWALDRMYRVFEENKDKGVEKIKRLLFREAMGIIEEDRLACRRMASFGATFIKDNDSILTHCNAGALATFDYGTALGVLYKAREQGKRFRVFFDETRPLLQGARLTAWELLRHKIDATLICDNMAAEVMKKGLVNKVLVGADRIASNGDVANKVGTYSVACLSKTHNIPFYVVAPISTFDMSLKSGEDIPIEFRKPEEIIWIKDIQIAPRDIKVYNPAFDVTPHKLITAMITDIGIFKPPYEKGLLKVKRLIKH
ncbi:MAG: S-methyl-5-thioribose-1-phosphate isomerase [Candidatus Omnitrophica bacterium]|nr:S-methyl-5-thioribose-1-phosphate isomerase [Candidatus Omnitrophota bacterium]